jgi:hypothetical protein
MAPQRLRWAPQNSVGAWLHHSPMLALVHHRSNLAVPEFLQMVAHNFVVHLLLGSWKNRLLQSFLSYFFFTGTRSPSSNQSSFPSRKSLNLRSGRGKFTLATLKPPLSSLLMFLLHFIYSNPREVPARRCFGFLVIPSLKKIANMER